jgi:hypothetical protein
MTDWPIIEIRFDALAACPICMAAKLDGIPAHATFQEHVNHYVLIHEYKLIGQTWDGDVRVAVLKHA